MPQPSSQPWSQPSVTGLAAKRCCCRVDDVFRDIRCNDEEEEGALHRVTAHEVVMAMEKRCEDTTLGRWRAWTVATTRTMTAGQEIRQRPPEPPVQLRRSPRRKPNTTGRLKVMSCKMHVKRQHPETDQPEVSYEVAERSSEAESKGEEDLAKRNVSSDGEECVQELEREDRPMEVAEGAETHTAEIIEAMQSTEIVIVESQEVSSQEGAASEKMGEGIAVSGSGKDRREDALLDLFNEAWQQKLA